MTTSSITSEVAVLSAVPKVRLKQKAVAVQRWQIQCQSGCDRGFAADTSTMHWTHGHVSLCQMAGISRQRDVDYVIRQVSLHIYSYLFLRCSCSRASARAEPATHCQQTGLCDTS